MVPEIGICSSARMIDHKAKVGGIRPVLAQEFRLLRLSFHDLSLLVHKIDATVKNIDALRLVKDILSSDFEGLFLSEYRSAG